eukprot:4503591-Amphidinium_carterae.1
MDLVRNICGRDGLRKGQHKAHVWAINYLLHAFCVGSGLILSSGDLPMGSIDTLVAQLDSCRTPHPSLP